VYCASAGAVFPLPRLARVRETSNPASDRKARNLTSILTLNLVLLVIVHFVVGRLRLSWKVSPNLFKPMPDRYLGRI